MPVSESCLTSQNKPDDCHTGETHQPGGKLADALQSQIINAFEAAIYQGMRPKDALAVILSWMSSEMMRIQADPVNGSKW